MGLAVGRSEYSGISERCKAHGNPLLTKNLNKLNRPEHKMEKRRAWEGTV